MLRFVSLASLLVLFLLLVGCTDRMSPTDPGPEESPVEESAATALSPGPVTAEGPQLGPASGPGPVLEPGQVDGPGLQPAPGGGPTRSATASASADGLNDFVWRNRSTGELIIWLMSGTTRDQDVAVGQVGDTDWQVVGVGDYTGSGTRDDLAWHNGATGEIVVWEMDGTSRTNVINVGTVGNTDWQIVGTGDYTGSGTRDDLAWHNGATGEIVVWEMDGTNRTNVVSVGTVANTDWRIRAVGDLSESGTPDDLVWRNPSTGGTVLWEMNGTSRTNVVHLSTVASDWKVETTGDYESDGFDNDITWRRPSTGDDVLWEMDGTSRTNVVHILDVGVSDWRIEGTGQFVAPTDIQAVDLDTRPTGLLTTETTDVVLEVNNPGGGVSSYDWRVLDVTASTVLQTGTVNSAPAGTSTLEVTGLGPFSQGPRRFAVELDPSDAIDEDDEANNRAEAPIHVQASGFGIEVQFDDGLSQEAMDLVTGDPDGADGGANQMDRWLGKITGELADFDPTATASGNVDLDGCFGSSTSTNFGTRTAVIDDVLVLITEKVQDGVGGTLAFAGPCFIRVPPDADGDLPRTTIIGRIVLDSEDVQSQSASLMEETVAHEMGHVLGLLFGPFSGSGADFAENTGDSDGLCLWVGASAVEQYQALGGTGTSLATDKEECGHWDETEFDDEMMTPFISSPPTPLSVLSVGALADRAYAVDMSAAESYSLPSSGSLRAGGVSLGDHIQLAPLYEVDVETGVVRTVITPDGREILRPHREP